MNYPRISIVICTRNRLNDLRECLSALSRVQYPNYEVIVVDSSSEKISEAVRELATEFNCRFMLEKRKGLSIARNRGIRESSGKIVAFTDDDAIPDGHWLNELAKSFEKENVDFVCGKVNIAYGSDEIDSIPAHAIYENTFWGCNVAFKREVLEKIKGFNERFRYAGEDQDIIVKALDKGFKGVYNSQAIVWHVKPPERNFREHLKIELRNGKADTFFVVKDMKILISNFHRIPFSMVKNVLNTLAILFLTPLILLAVFSVSNTFAASVSVILIVVYMAVRVMLGKTKRFALILALISPGLSVLYWYYSFRAFIEL